MANFAFTATTSSQVITELGNEPKVVVIRNLGTNPVSIRFVEDGAAVYGEGITLPTQNSMYAFENRDLYNFQEAKGTTSVISSGGNSALSIYSI